MPNVEVTLTTTAKNLDQYAEVQAKLAGLDVGVDKLNASVNQSTGMLKVHGTAMVGSAQEAEALAGKLEGTGIKVTGLATKTGGAAKEAESLTEKFSKGSAAFGQYGAQADGLLSKLTGLSNVLGSAGPVGMGIAAVGAALAVGVEVGKSSIDTYVRLADEVLKFQRITGGTAEESSRLVAVLKDFGIGGDVAAQAMFRMNNRLNGVTDAETKGAKTLQELNIEVVRTADGHVDLLKTLENVSDAYAAAGTAAERDTILFSAFGKSGAAMGVAMEGGSARLKEMAANAELIFTSGQLEAAHNYEIQLRQTGQAMELLQVDLGTKILPVASNAATGLDVVADAVHRLAAGETSSLPAAFGLAAEHQHLGQAALEARDKIDAATQAMKVEEAQMKGLLDADLGEAQAALNRERASQGVTTAQRALADETLKDSEYADKHTAATNRVAAAQEALTKAVRDHGPASAQANAAQDQLNAARAAGAQVDQQNADAASRLSAQELALKDAMLRDVEAASKVAEQQAAVAGQHLSAAQAAHVQAAELDTLKASAGGVLPDELEILRQKLHGLAGDYNVNVHLNVMGGVPSSPTYGIPGGYQVTSAEGGIFTRPTLTWVGEAGPEAVIPVRQGNTMPGARPLESLSGSGGGPPLNVTFHIQGGDPEATAAAVNARLSALLTAT